MQVRGLQHLGAEMMLPVWLRLMGVLGTGRFNFKVVR